MKCLFCNSEVVSDNPRAKYCSDSCRVQYNRKKSRGPLGDAPDTSDVDEIAMEESYNVPGVDPFWTKPHKLTFGSSSEWRGCCVDVDLWRATCNQTKEVVEAKSYHEMMSKCREIAKTHISEEVANPHWTARMPQSVKPPRDFTRTESQLPTKK